jgi:hypothetical protein
MTREQKPYSERTTPEQRREYRQRRMRRAKKLHRELIRQLCLDRFKAKKSKTAKPHCAICGKTHRLSELEVDHERGKRWRAKQFRYDARVDRYVEEYKRGVKLRPACRPCNRMDGVARRKEGRVSAAED